MTFYTKYVSTVRMRFFAISWMLHELCGAEALDRLDRLRSSLRDRRRTTGLIKGYKLVVETMLYRQIELVVIFPDILRLRGDEALQLWWSNTDQKSAGRLNSFVSSDAPNSVFVANHVNDLLLRMVRAGNRWDRFVDASMDVRSYAATLLLLAEDCQAVFLRDEVSEPVTDKRHVLRVGGAECLHDFVFDRGNTTLNDAWDYTNAATDEWLEPRTPVVHWMSEVETSKDTVSTIARRRRRADDFTVMGIDAAIAIASGAPTSVDGAIAESARVAQPDEKPLRRSPQRVSDGQMAKSEIRDVVQQQVAGRRDKEPHVIRKISAGPEGASEGPPGRQRFSDGRREQQPRTSLRSARERSGVFARRWTRGSVEDRAQA